MRTKKDIYEFEPNFKITFPEEDTEEVVHILRTMRYFKEKGTHSPYTNDYVQYWYVGNFGVVYGFLWSVQWIKSNGYSDEYRERMWQLLNKRLQNSGIVYRIEII